MFLAMHGKVKEKTKLLRKIVREQYYPYNLCINAYMCECVYIRAYIFIYIHTHIYMCVCFCVLCCARLIKHLCKYIFEELNTISRNINNFQYSVLYSFLKKYDLFSGKKDINEPMLSTVLIYSIVFVNCGFLPFNFQNVCFIFNYVFGLLILLVINCKKFAYLFTSIVKNLVTMN